MSVPQSLSTNLEKMFRDTVGQEVMLQGQAILKLLSICKKQQNAIHRLRNQTHLGIDKSLQQDLRSIDKDLSDVLKFPPTEKVID